MSFESIVSRLLRYIARSSMKHPVVTCLLWIVLGAAGGILGALFLKTDSNQENLISEQLPYNRRYKKYLEEFGDQEFIYAVIGVPEAGSPHDQSMRKRAAKAADDLASNLKPLVAGGYLKEVKSRIEIPRIEERFLLYEPPKHLEKLVNGVLAAGALLEARDLPELIQKIRNLGLSEFASGSQPASKETGSNYPRSAFPAQSLQKIFEGIKKAVEGSKGVVVPELLPRIPNNKLWLESHLFTQKGSAPGSYDPTRPGLVLVRIMPEKDFSSLSVIRRPLREIRKAVARVEEEFPGLDIGVTGRPVIHSDEMHTTRNDVNRAASVAFPLVFFIFIIVFRSVVRPLLAAVALAIAISCTYGFAYLAVGSLNLLSVVFILILIGLGVDFGIHILARYVEELQTGKQPSPAAERSVVLSGRGCLSAAVTTAVAFLSTLFTDFAGLAELGLVCGVGILFCLATALSFLPASLVLLDERRSKQTRVRGIIQLPVLGLGARLHRPIIFISVLLAAIAAPFLLKVQLNRNLLELQAKDLESVRYERRLMKESRISTWEAVCMVHTPQGARELTARLKKLPEVKNAQTYQSLLPAPEYEEARREILQKAGRLLAKLEPEPVSSELNVSELETALKNLLALTRLLPAEKVPEVWAPALRELELACHALHTRGASPKAVKQRLVSYQKEVLRSVRSYFPEWQENWRKAFSPPPLHFQDLSEHIRERFVAQEDGSKTYLVRVWPSGDAWEFPVLKEFVKAVEKASPGATGVAFNFYESVKVMERAFMLAFLLCLGFVSVLVFLDMHSLRLGVFALGTLLLGLLWTGAGVGATELKVNLANFFAFPVLLGLGIDSAFHMLHRAKESNHTRGSLSLSPVTATAVILSSLTSFLGLGSLITARHRGIASLGELLAIGTVLCLTASLVVLPAFLCLLRERKRQKK